MSYGTGWMAGSLGKLQIPESEQIELERSFFSPRHLRELKKVKASFKPGSRIMKAVGRYSAERGNECRIKAWFKEVIDENFLDLDNIEFDHERHPRSSRILSIGIYNIPQHPKKAA